MGWCLLQENIQISRLDRSNNEKALEFKDFNLKMKAWTVLMKFFNPGETRFYSNSLLDLSNSQVNEQGHIDYSIYDLAEHKRMTVLFTALRYGIKARHRADANSELSYKHMYQTYISKGLIALRMLMVRKKKVRQRAVRLRKIHLQNLVVKSFSALLFNCQSEVRVRNLNAMATYFFKQRFLNRWLREKAWRDQTSVQIEHLQAHWRQRIVKKCFFGLSEGINKLASLDHRAFRTQKTTNYMLGNKFLQAWRLALKKKEVEGRVIKFRVFNEFKALTKNNFALK